MKEIKAYKLSNGKVVEDIEQAMQMELEIKIKEQLEFLWDEYLSGLDSASEAADIIYRNRNQFLSALNMGILNLQNQTL